MSSAEFAAGLGALTERRAADFAAAAAADPVSDGMPGAAPSKDRDPG